MKLKNILMLFILMSLKVVASENLKGIVSIDTSNNPIENKFSSCCFNCLGNLISSYKPDQAIINIKIVLADNKELFYGVPLTTFIKPDRIFKNIGETAYIQSDEGRFELTLDDSFANLTAYYKEWLEDYRAC